MRLLVLISFLLMQVYCIAQDNALETEVQYKSSDKTLVFLLKNHTDKDLYIRNAWEIPLEQGYFSIIAYNASGKQLHHNYFNFIQDGEDCKKVFSIPPFSTIKCSYEIPDLLYRMPKQLQNNIKKIEVKAYIRYVAVTGGNIKEIDYSFNY